MGTNDKGPVTHGLALSIRSATESEVFDLGGLGPDTIEQVVADALSQPFSARQEMIRITLVTGAGKQSRQKYHAQAMKVVTSTLQNKCGFVEDRGASCVMECQGMYKVQHDTGKNLKTVVLFPKMDAVSSSSSGSNNNNNNNNNNNHDESQAYSDNTTILFPVNSMEYKAAASSLNVFQNMVKAKCTTWSQKKALIALIQQDFVEQIIEPVEDLLMRGQVVPSDLQHYYDNVLTEITEKQEFVKEAMHQQAEVGDLTEYELNLLLEQVEHRIAAAKNKSDKHAAKLRERKAMLKSFTPVPMPKLQHHAALGKLWKQVYALNIPLDLDVNNNSGRLLSVQESKLVAKRDDLLQEIEQLEYASQGWLEEDEIFEWRLQECRNEFEQRFGGGSNNNKRSGKKSMTGSYNQSTSSSSSSRKPITNWITPADKKGPTTVTKKKNKLKKQDLFSAMMAASSSEEEDSDVEDGDNDNGGNSNQKLGAASQKSTTTNKPRQQSRSQPKTPVESSSQAKKSITQEEVNNSSATTTSSSSKNKKRNKKKKKGKTSSDSLTANEKEVGQNSSVLESESSDAADSQWSVPMAIVHVIMAILSWLVSILLYLVSSMTNKKKGNKKKKKSL